MKFGSLKRTSLITLLALSGCKHVADAPAVFQCQWNGSPRMFYCVNTETKERKLLEPLDPSMRAAQCLSPEDYRTMSAYVDYLIQEAERRCR